LHDEGKGVGFVAAGVEGCCPAFLLIAAVARFFLPMRKEDNW
jgi:hypothetical protein